MKMNTKDKKSSVSYVKPAWFSLLKKGKEYTNQDLVDLSGTQRRSVDIVMKNHGVKFKYIIENGRLKKVYTWEG